MLYESRSRDNAIAKKHIVWYYIGLMADEKDKFDNFGDPTAVSSDAGAGEHFADATGAPLDVPVGRPDVPGNSVVGWHPVGPIDDGTRAPVGGDSDGAARFMHPAPYPAFPPRPPAPTEPTPSPSDELSNEGEPLLYSVDPDVDPGDHKKRIFAGRGLGLRGWRKAAEAEANNFLEDHIPAARNESVRKVTGTVVVAVVGAAALLGAALWIKNGSPFDLGIGGDADPSQAGAGSGTSSSATTTTSPSSPSAEVAPPASSSSHAAETTTTTTTTAQPSTTSSSQPPETSTTTTTTTEATTTTTTNPTTSTTTPTPSSPNTSGSLPADPSDPGNPGTPPDAGPADPNVNGEPTVNSRTVQPGDNVYKIGAREEGLDSNQISEGLRDGSINAYDHGGNLVADPGKIQPGYTVEFTTPATTPPLPEVAPADAVILGDGGTLSDSAPDLLEGAGKPITGENVHNATEAIMMYNQETYGIDLTWESAHDLHSVNIDGNTVAVLHGQVVHMPPIGMLDELMARAEELSPTN